MTITTVNTRQLVRNHKAVLDRVRQTGEPAIVVREQQPQVAIVSLDDLAELRRVRALRAQEAIKHLAHEISTTQAGSLPKDMSERHDQYFTQTWADQEEQSNA